MQNRPDTPAELRVRAAQARRHAQALWPDRGAAQLRAYADELDARAATEEQVTEGDRQKDHSSR